jgi:hypothetical protein
MPGTRNSGTRHPGARDRWDCVLELGEDRSVVAGSPEALRRAIARGADLRIATDFRHNEHIDVASDNDELVNEVSDFRVTYLVDGRWTAGIMNLRMPLVLPAGFGPRASLSFFLYNEDGRQAIARPYLDGGAAPGRPGPSPRDDHGDMPRYHQLDGWDALTNAPSSNFVYDFYRYRYLVWDGWREAYAHNASGEPVRGSLEDLVEAFTRGCEVKVGIRGLCRELADGGLGEQGLDHEVFLHCGPCYYGTGQRVFSAGTQPGVRVAPAIPMRYRSGGWDFGWFMPQSDGVVAYWICDPYTLRFRKAEGRHQLRWFVR